MAGALGSDGHGHAVPVPRLALAVVAMVRERRAADARLAVARPPRRTRAALRLPGWWPAQAAAARDWGQRLPRSAAGSGRRGRGSPASRAAGGPVRSDRSREPTVWIAAPPRERTRRVAGACPRRRALPCPRPARAWGAAGEGHPALGEAALLSPARGAAGRGRSGTRFGRHARRVPGCPVRAPRCAVAGTRRAGGLGRSDGADLPPRSRRMPARAG